jgi:hypothetical protein
MVLFVILGFLAAWAFEVWVVMMLLGGLHHEVNASIPALGWLGSFLITIVLNIIVSLFKQS